MSSIQDFVRLNIYKLNHFALYHLKTKMTKEKKTLIDTDGTLFQRNKRRQRLVFCRYCGCSKRTDVLEKHCRAIHKRPRAVLKQGQMPFDSAKDEEARNTSELSGLSDEQKVVRIDATRSKPKMQAEFGRCREQTTVERSSRSSDS
jgi:hypothetical protein